MDPRNADHADVSTSYTFLATDDYSSTPKTAIAGKANYTIFVQRITMGVTTDNAATQQFQDSADTPVPIAKSKASPGLGPIMWDFGDNGIALTQGKALKMLSSAAGLAASVTITAYRKLTAVQNLDPNN